MSEEEMMAFLQSMGGGGGGRGRRGGGRPRGGRGRAGRSGPSRSKPRFRTNQTPMKVGTEQQQRKGKPVSQAQPPPSGPLKADTTTPAGSGSSRSRSSSDGGGSGGGGSTSEGEAGPKGQPAATQRCPPPSNEVPPLPSPGGLAQPTAVDRDLGRKWIEVCKPSAQPVSVPILSLLTHAEYSAPEALPPPPPPPAGALSSCVSSVTCRAAVACPLCSPSPLPLPRQQHGTGLT